MKAFLFIVALIIVFLIAFTTLRPDSQPEVGVIGPCGNVYTVREGDTLESIAQRCGTSVSALLSANEDALKYGPYQGLVLTIPHSTADAVIPVTSGEALVAPVQDSAKSAYPAPVIELVPTLAPPAVATPVVPVLLPVTGGDSSASSAAAYTVGTRETLYSIARRFGVSVAALLAANPSITDPDLIYAGQTILIPR